MSKTSVGVVERFLKNESAGTWRGRAGTDDGQFTKRVWAVKNEFKTLALSAFLEARRTVWPWSDLTCKSGITDDLIRPESDLIRRQKSLTELVEFVRRMSRCSVVRYDRSAERRNDVTRFRINTNADFVAAHRFVLKALHALCLPLMVEPILPFTILCTK